MHYKNRITQDVDYEKLEGPRITCHSERKYLITQYSSTVYIGIAMVYPH